MILWLSLIGLVLAALLYKWGRYFYHGFRLPGPSGLPILGNLLSFRTKDLCVIFNEMLKYLQIYGPITRLWLGPVLVVIVAGPEEVARVVDQDKVGHRGRYSERILKPFFKEGLLAQEDTNVWKIHRKIVTNAFQNSMLNKFVENFAKNSEILASRLGSLADGAHAHDILPYLCQCTMDIIAETCFAYNMNAQVDNNVVALEHNKVILDSTQARISDPLLIVDWLFYRTSLGRKYREAVRYYHDIIRGRLEERRAGVGVGTAPTLLGLLLQSGQLSEDDILGEISTVGGAGTDTTASLVTFLLAILAEHQDIQEKVLEEQRGIFQEDFLRPVKSEDLPRMVYLEQVKYTN